MRKQKHETIEYWGMVITMSVVGYFTAHVFDWPAWVGFLIGLAGMIVYSIFTVWRDEKE